MLAGMPRMPKNLWMMKRMKKGQDPLTRMARAKKA
jgi:hypothetical protein